MNTETIQHSAHKRRKYEKLDQMRVLFCLLCGLPQFCKVQMTIHHELEQKEGDHERPRSTIPTYFKVQKYLETNHQLMK